MIAGKNILITGANGGIGFAVAKLLAEQKANLTLLYHKNYQQLENFSTPGQSLVKKKVDLDKCWNYEKWILQMERK